MPNHLMVHYSFRTSVAQVAEVTVGPDGAVKADRVVCAVDCGVAINPDVIRAQMEGGVSLWLGRKSLWRDHIEER